jgi:truncated hemoglobin YjbI
VVTEVSGGLRQTQSSIYGMIGGEAALAPVVDDFCDRVLADPELCGFFAGANMTRLKGRQTEFLAAALGGALPYAGPSLRDAHRARRDRARGQGPGRWAGYMDGAVQSGQRAGREVIAARATAAGS